MSYCSSNLLPKMWKVLIERSQNTRSITVCLLRGLHSQRPVRVLSNAESMDQWKTPESHFLWHHVDGQVHVHRFQGTRQRMQASEGSVMLWAIFCSKASSAAIHVDVTLTCTAYLSIVADHLQPFMEMKLAIGCGSFQQDNVLSHKAKTGMV